MEKIIEDIIIKYYQTKAEKTHDFGGGFYSRVFMVKINKEPYNVIVKIYLFPKLAVKEALQMNTLSKYSLLKIPKIY